MKRQFTAKTLRLKRENFLPVNWQTAMDYQNNEMVIALMWPA